MNTVHASTGELAAMIVIGLAIVIGWVVVEWRREETRRLEFKARREERAAADSLKLLQSALDAAQRVQPKPNETKPVPGLVTALCNVLTDIADAMRKLGR